MSMLRAYFVVTGAYLIGVGVQELTRPEGVQWGWGILAGILLTVLLFIAAHDAD